MNSLTLGERVLVKPTHPCEQVQRAAGMHGQFLKPGFQEVVLDSFLLARFLDGSIAIQPLPKPFSDDEKRVFQKRDEPAQMQGASDEQPERTQKVREDSEERATPRMGRPVAFQTPKEE